MRRPDGPEEETGISNALLGGINKQLDESKLVIERRQGASPRVRGRGREQDSSGCGSRLRVDLAPHAPRQLLRGPPRGKKEAKKKKKPWRKEEADR